MKKSFEFEIVENIAILSKGSKGWQREVNIVKWNGGEPKFDIRDWSPEHDKMGKGICLTDEELLALSNIFGDAVPQETEEEAVEVIEQIMDELPEEEERKTEVVEPEAEEPEAEEPKEKTEEQINEARLLYYMSTFGEDAEAVIAQNYAADYLEVIDQLHTGAVRVVHIVGTDSFEGVIVA